MKELTGCEGGDGGSKRRGEGGLGFKKVTVDEGGDGVWRR